MKNHSQTSVVLGNAAFLTISTFISQILVGITGIYIVRYLGLSLYSDYSTAMLFMSAFSIFGRLGFNRVFLRECSKDISMTEKYYAASLFLNTTLVIVSWLVALGIARYRYSDQIFNLTIILGLSQVFMALDQTPTKVFQVHQRMVFRSFIGIVASILYTAAFFVAIHAGVSVVVLATLHLSMNVLRFLLSICLSFKLTGISFDRIVLRQIFKAGISFCVIDIMMTFYSQSSAFMLALFNIGDEAGIYNAAARIFAVFQMVGQVLDTAICPALYQVSESADWLMERFSKVLKYFTVCGFYASVVLIGRAEWIITTVFEAEFSKSTSVLSIFSFAMIFRYIFIPANHIIYAIHKERLMMYTMTISAFLSVALSLLFIPWKGAVGAVIVFLMVEILMTVICVIRIDYYFKKEVVIKTLLWPLLSSLITGSFLYLTANRYPVTGLVASGVIFWGFLILCRYYKYAELAFLFKSALSQLPVKGGKS